MNNIVRELHGEELFEALYSLNQYSLHSSPPFQNLEEWMAVVRPRKGMTCHAAMAEKKPLSIAVSSAMTQNVRGKLFPASGVWGVSTDPSARRKGYCRQVMASLLAAECETGKVFTTCIHSASCFTSDWATFPIRWPKSPGSRLIHWRRCSSLTWKERSS